MTNFELYEFDSPDEIGSGQNMQEDFLTKLDEARTLAGVPFVINSGYRTIERNNKVGGKSNSAHLFGYAADISCSNSRDRFIIINALIQSGFNRVGIADTFIHVDCDPNKSKNVIWTY